MQTNRSLLITSALTALSVIAASVWMSRRPSNSVDAVVAAQASPPFDCPSTPKPLPDPFANNYGKTPGTGYSGPLFTLSHRYPTARPAPPADPPWRRALNGQPISPRNAMAYVNALKDFVGADMRRLILQYDQWDADALGWYNEPWIANDRESIHGMYMGTPFPKGAFRQLKNGMVTWVVTYYGKTAGYTVGQVWADPQNPNVQNAQYQEGAVIVKIAATTASPQEWAPMEGAVGWPLYGCPVDMTPNFSQGTPTGPPAVTTVRIFQVDIIVKDTATSPVTGWVFSTLVHDNRVPGDAWDKLIPLGAMWGNDPGVTDATALRETVLNPAAPPYATETLGWGGRLSGPNDGAVVAPASINGQTQPAVAASSCMSCHGPAEYPTRSFLLPSPPPSSTDPADPTFFGPQGPNDPIVMILNAPGSPAWNRWFQDRKGTAPQDPGSVALDFDMVLAAKSLPAWSEVKNPTRGVTAVRRPFRARLYHGR